MLNELAARFWRLVCEYSPTVATVRGEHGFNDVLRSFQDQDLDDLADRFRSIEAEVRALDTTQWDTQGRITAGLLAHESDIWATEIEDRFMVAAVDPYLGAHTRILSDTQQNTVQTADQAYALLDRYRSVRPYLEGALALSLENARAGMTPAAASVERVLSQLDGYLASGLDDDPFLKLSLPGTDPEATTTWREKAREIVTTVIRPAVADYRSDLATEIGPIARPDDKAGLVWMTGGERIYASLVHKYTQTGRSAAEIHGIGQDWGTDILVSEWVDIGKAAFGLGTMEETFERLHTDPEMRFNSEEEMLQHARDTVARAWEAVDGWFNIKPDTPCVVVPVPAAFAAAMPPAYYMQPPTDGSRPGTYFLNTHKPQERDKFEYQSTHFHEAIPGHHFDRSIAASLEGIPEFRRYSQVYAHTEGWGLYSERLADEMGLFSSDVDRLGMLSADAWRAGRLVVDTGMHALGWSRQQAIAWLRQWTPIGLLTIEQEVDRYIGMPGQALSYKMGQLEIMSLRAEAEAALGGAFDIKAFHDVMLANGAMTLPMLREMAQAELLA